MSKESTTTSEGKGKAKFNFQAQTPMELSLIKGEMVTLTRRVDQNWYEGRIGSRKGIFPATYIDILVDPGETRGIINFKMTHLFYFIAFSIFIIMLMNIHMLNDETLRIPKW